MSHRSITIRARATARAYDEPLPGLHGAPQPEESSTIDPITILAIAAGTRLDDPRQELERIVHLGIVLDAAREASRAIHTWVMQSQSEYRGTRSAWDLKATSGHLRIALARYEQAVEDASTRLRCLLPELDHYAPRSASPSADGRRIVELLPE